MAETRAARNMGAIWCVSLMNLFAFFSLDVLPGSRLTDTTTAGFKNVKKKKCFAIFQGTGRGSHVIFSGESEEFDILSTGGGKKRQMAARLYYSYCLHLALHLLTLKHNILSNWQRNK